MKKSLYATLLLCGSQILLSGDAPAVQDIQNKDIKAADAQEKHAQAKLEALLEKQAEAKKHILSFRTASKGVQKGLARVRELSMPAYNALLNLLRADHVQLDDLQAPHDFSKGKKFELQFMMKSMPKWYVVKIEEKKFEVYPEKPINK